MNILVVDDSKVMRSIVIRTLKQAGFGDHIVNEADDGASGLAAILACPPDVVLSDWNMPGIPGIEFLRTLRAEGDTTPFVFVTSEGTEEMRLRAVGSGATDVITKPFTAERFQAVLGGIIR